MPRPCVSAVAAALICSAALGAGLPLGIVISPSDELAGELRGLLLKHMPDPLYDGKKDWDHTREFTPLRPGRHEKIVRNDGLWRKIRVVALVPKDNLVLDLRDVTNQPDGRMLFTVYVACDVEFDVTQQRWVRGVKLYDASLRAQARVKITLECEATSRAEPGGLPLLPDVVFQIKVLKADARYDQLEFKHVAGMGGDLAKVVGETAHDILNKWKPSLERELLEKANAAIVKAGEKKEVRLSLSKLLTGKK